MSFIKNNLGKWIEKQHRSWLANIVIEMYLPGKFVSDTQGIQQQSGTFQTSNSPI